MSNILRQRYSVRMNRNTDTNNKATQKQRIIESRKFTNSRNRHHNEKENYNSNETLTSSRNATINGERNQRIGRIMSKEMDLLLSLGLINHPASEQSRIQQVQDQYPSAIHNNNLNKSDDLNNQKSRRRVGFIDPLVTRMRSTPRIHEKDLSLFFYSEKEIDE